LISNSMKPLIKYQDYSRKEVHDIFEPHTRFVTRGGPWGNWGAIKIDKRPGDYVFLATLGTTQSGHKFDEGITEDGVLTWQSQPGQGLKEGRIREWIRHDETINSIHFFLRINKRKNAQYTYLGLLKYISHDTTREKPVYFNWQILDWDIAQQDLDRTGLKLIESAPEPKDFKLDSLVAGEPPAKYETKVQSTETFRSKKRPDYSKRDEKNRRIGDAGELLVLKLEIEFLKKEGLLELAERVRHTSKLIGDSAGYDIESYNKDGGIKYIEVKTTQGGNDTDFFMSSNEVAFSESHPNNYYLYRVYDFSEKVNSAKFFVINGDLKKNLILTPIQYRLSHKRLKEQGQ